MVKQIILENQTINYILRPVTRAKRLRLTIKAGGEILVSGPKWASIGSIEEWMKSKAQWILQKIEELKKLPRRESKTESNKAYREYKNQALVIAQQKVTYFNEIYQFDYQKISIRNSKTRWGSCSKKGNLNFNYKIALLPDELANYLVVHELCHLVEFNHGKNFWQLVSKTIPNYKRLRIKLRAQ